MDLGAVRIKTISTVQSGTALHLLDSQPGRAREALTAIRETGKAAMAEMRTTVGRLRSAGEPAVNADRDAGLARMPDLQKFSDNHGIGIVTIRDLIAYRRRWEKLVELRAEASLPTEYGLFTIKGYEDSVSGETHVALVMGEISADQPVLLRAHSECLTGDAFHSLRCDCEQQLHRAMEMIASEGIGVILYLRQEGRGIGLINKLRAYQLQDQGMDTVEANEALGLPVDKRDYGIGAQILADLGVQKIRLISNSPRKYYGIESFGLEIVERIPMIVPPNEHNVRYLRTKSDKLGHIMHD